MLTSLLWEILKHNMFNFRITLAMLPQELKILIRNLEKFLRKQLSTSWSVTFNKVRFNEGLLPNYTFYKEMKS